MKSFMQESIKYRREPHLGEDSHNADEKSSLLPPPIVPHSSHRPKNFAKHSVWPLILKTGSITCSILTIIALALVSFALHIRIGVAWVQICLIVLAVGCLAVSVCGYRASSDDLVRYSVLGESESASLFLCFCFSLGLKYLLLFFVVITLFSTSFFSHLSGFSTPSSAVSHLKPDEYKHLVTSIMRYTGFIFTFVMITLGINGFASFKMLRHSMLSRRVLSILNHCFVICGVLLMTGSLIIFSRIPLLVVKLVVCVACICILTGGLGVLSSSYSSSRGLTMYCLIVGMLSILLLSAGIASWVHSTDALSIVQQNFATLASLTDQTSQVEVAVQEHLRLLSVSCFLALAMMLGALGAALHTRWVIKSNILQTTF
eukprot:GILI01014576.1.p1 GENE.GILI01014576.1~~GILI01014576.1.p1  ORF type:complete len:373 (+),score=19.65 GILI01014576.1:86-1204(+)